MRKRQLISYSGAKLGAMVFSGTVLRKIGFTLFLLIFFIINAFPGIPGSSRYKFDVAIGYGFPESICLKLKYGNIFQVGLSQAFDTQGLGPGAVEFYYRIGEKPRLLDQKPWYVFLGAAAYILDVDYKKEYKLLIYPRIGRTFEFSKRMGTNIDIGPGFPLGRNTSDSNVIAPVVLTGSISLYLRF
ncbi:MAG: hypothetical protein JXN62_05285 [Bacteroidales bacterium]|nr:hypothetical protein [Bacteroidales bacterium]